jgi:hypothetical protein
MRTLGFLLLVLGIGSSVVTFMDMEMRLLGWINNWGEEVAWGIRGGCVLLGLVLIAAGKKKDGKKK